MSAILARLGPLETRRAAETIWKSGKGSKRRNWTCADCRARQLQQRRSYGDDSLRFTDGGSILFSGEGEHGEGKRERQREGENTTSNRTNWRASPKEHGSQHVRGARIRETFSNGAFKRSFEPAVTVENEEPQGEEKYEADLWEQFELADEDHDSQNASTTTKDVESIDREETLVQDGFAHVSPDELLNLDYKSQLSPALLGEEADVVARCLFAANQCNDLEFLRAIPSTTFSEIIRLLEPSRFVSRLGNTHVELSSAMVRTLRIAPMYRVALEYSSVLRQVLGIRRSADIKPTFTDYTVLLRSARDLGSPKFGMTIWNAMMNDEHVPNTTCYNHYMSTVVWRNLHSAGPRQHVRIIPFNMLQRTKDNNTRWRNYKVGERGVKGQAMRIFNDMLANGAIADEESFRILITAAAREGDMTTAKSVLNRVWGINVDAIMQGKDERTIAPKQIPKHSPMRPTPRLLFTVAHAFGINNDIPGALRVVDFIAQNFNLAISNDVWEQLFEWTFVLAYRRTGTLRRHGETVGQLPQQSVMSLWNTMTGPPYSIKPTMGMYNYLIKNLRDRQQMRKMLVKMREARELHEIHRAATRNAYLKFTKVVSLKTVRPYHPIGIEKCRNRWEHAELVKRRNAFWLRRWVRLYLGFQPNSTGRSEQELPGILWEWRDFLPATVRYETSTGFVELARFTDEEIVESHKRRMERLEHRRELLDKAQKYIGDLWLDNKQIPVPKRLREHIEETGQIPEIVQRVMGIGGPVRRVAG